MFRAMPRKRHLQNRTIPRARGDDLHILTSRDAPSSPQLALQLTSLNDPSRTSNRPANLDLTDLQTERHACYEGP
jgi:hypothetical protein